MRVLLPLALVFLASIGSALGFVHHSRSRSLALNAQKAKETPEKNGKKNNKAVQQMGKILKHYFLDVRGDTFKREELKLDVHRALLNQRIQNDQKKKEQEAKKRKKEAQEQKVTQLNKMANEEEEEARLKKKAKAKEKEEEARLAKEAAAYEKTVKGVAANSLKQDEPSKKAQEEAVTKKTAQERAKQQFEVQKGLLEACIQNQNTAKQQAKIIEVPKAQEAKKKVQQEAILPKQLESKQPAKKSQEETSGKKVAQERAKQQFELQKKLLEACIQNQNTAKQQAKIKQAQEAKRKEQDEAMRPNELEAKPPASKSQEEASAKEMAQEKAKQQFETQKSLLEASIQNQNTAKQQAKTKQSQGAKIKEQEEAMVFKELGAEKLAEELEYTRVAEKLQRYSEEDAEKTDKNHPPAQLLALDPPPKDTVANRKQKIAKQEQLKRQKERHQRSLGEPQPTPDKTKKDEKGVSSFQAKDQTQTEQTTAPVKPTNDLTKKMIQNLAKFQQEEIKRQQETFQQSVRKKEDAWPDEEELRVSYQSTGRQEVEDTGATAMKEYLAGLQAEIQLSGGAVRSLEAERLKAAREAQYQAYQQRQQVGKATKEFAAGTERATPTLPSEDSQDPMIGRILLQKYEIAGKLQVVSTKCEIYTAFHTMDFGKKDPLIVKLTNNPDNVRNEYEIHRDLFLRLQPGEGELFVRPYDWIDPQPDTDGKAGFVMECGWENLRGHIWRHGAYTGDRLRNAMYRVIRSVYALHALGVVWTELKAENFIVFEGGDIIKGADLESLALYQGMIRAYTAEAYPPEFPPDALYNELPQIPLDYSFDIWGLGLTLFEMASGEPFFTLQRTYDVPYIKERLRYPQSITAEVNKKLINVDPGAQNIIRRCLLIDPRQRCSCLDLLNDSYFTTPQSQVTNTQSQASGDQDFSVIPPDSDLKV